MKFHDVPWWTLTSKISYLLMPSLFDKWCAQTSCIQHFSKIKVQENRCTSSCSSSSFLPVIDNSTLFISNFISASFWFRNPHHYSRIWVLHPLTQYPIKSILWKNKYVIWCGLIYKGVKNKLTLISKKIFFKSIISLAFFCKFWSWDR